MHWRAIVFGEVLFLASIGLIHLSLDQPIDAGWAGIGGGIVGLGITQPLTELLGTFGARLVMLTALWPRSGRCGYRCRRGGQAAYSKTWRHWETAL